MKFGKVTKSEPVDEHTTKHTTNTYYNGTVANVKIEKEVSVMTSKSSFISDIIDSVKPLTAAQTTSISFEVKGQNGNPEFMKVRWTESTTDYGRK